MSGLVNKVKEALHSDKSHDNTHSTSTTHNTSGAPEGTHGPHGSRVANAADPRVDSDRDGSHNLGAQRTAGHGEYGSSTGGYTHGTGPTHAAHDTGLGATTGSSGFGHSTGTREGEHGPHGSRVANAADPRVDSDRDGSHNIGRTAGQGEYGSSTGGYTHGTTHNAGLGASTGTSGFTPGSNTGAREGQHGPHGSRTANALDPRVDSDRDGSRNAGAAYKTGSTGYSTGNTFGSSTGTREGEHGPHGSRVANAADPRVDSDRDGSRNAGAAYGTGHSTGNTFGTGHNTAAAGDGSSTTGHNTAAGLGNTGPGPAPNTAGPHKSDMVNKLDPRVDSNLDGSKTVGGNKTYQ
jgi:hypothetical protein